ncbi:MAG: hypothetical protein DRI75_09130 [Bacteroidetes bacterium]|nr:MAG: hypothetical protein DRI75_09130 [Bacteroidota bacterium]
MKLIKKIKELARLDSYFNKSNRNTYDTLASLLLHRLFPTSTILPFTPFSLNPNTILHIINEIQINKRNSIIEFGSGISTIIIAKYLKDNNIQASMISIEDNKEWAQYINELLKKYGCEDQAFVEYIPLKEYASEKYNGLWYDVAILSKAIMTLQFDLVIVDGPGAGNNKLIRLPALIEISNALFPDFIIFLDDTKRDGEKKIFYEWKLYLKEIGIRVSGEIMESKVYATINSGKGFSSNPMSY